MINAAEGEVLETTDLSPIPHCREDDKRWLSELAIAADTSVLALRMSGRTAKDIEPIVSYDEATGLWWAGRFVGEVQFQGRTLRVMPRFGMPELQRWLFRIYGVRLLASKGKYQASRVWLWELLSKVWEGQLLVAAKHGLPTVRLDDVYCGDTVKGRLDVRQTARMFSGGHRKVVSRPRSRRIDSGIGGIVLHAFGRLRQALDHHGNDRAWLTDRCHDIVNQLSANVSLKKVAAAASSRRAVRYTPITEGYRQVVELSRAISRQQPSASSAKGPVNVIGVLIDMAELWELYVFHVLRSGLPEVEVLHLGRSATTGHWLLRSEITGECIGKLIPDIVVVRHGTTRCVAVLDAKYKTTVPSEARPHGVLREDLYQMTAYMSAVGNANAGMVGGLIYPTLNESPSVAVLGSKSPWLLSGVLGRFWFFSLQVGGIDGIDIQASAEAGLIAGVRNALKETAAESRAK